MHGSLDAPCSNLIGVDSIISPLLFRTKTKKNKLKIANSQTIKVMQARRLITEECARGAERLNLNSMHACIYCMCACMQVDLSALRSACVLRLSRMHLLHGRLHANGLFYSVSTGYCTLLY